MSKSQLREFINYCRYLGGNITGEEFLYSYENELTVLLISHELSLTGAPVALLYMADCLKEMDRRCVVISPVDGPLREEIISRDIPLIILTAEKTGRAILEKQEAFEFVVVNTLDLFQIISVLNGTTVRTLWWIHEAAGAYREDKVKKMPRYLFANIKLVTVSNWSRRILKEHIPRYNAGSLLYCLPEMNTEITDREYALSKKGCKIFALVGSVENRKGHDILLQAISLLPEVILENCKFVFLGNYHDKDLYEELCQAQLKQPERIELIKQLKRDEMGAFYETIDCLICASRDDPMPVVVTEACQFSKLIICSENTGSAEILRNNKAGLIYRNNDPEELASCIMTVCSESDNSFEIIRKKARVVYEENFAPEVFARKLSELMKAMTNDPLEAEKEKTSELQQVVGELHEELLRLTDELQEANWVKGELSKELLVTMKELDIARNSFNEIDNSFFWKITKPARVVLDNTKKIKALRECVQLTKKTIKSARTKGFKFTARKIKNTVVSAPTYDQWMIKHRVSDKKLEKQRCTSFKEDILFSITVPLYNTPELFLREMIESVIAQTYGGWELCLADGSDGEHSYVKSICEEYAGRDTRVKYRKLTENRGISGNTNACLDMATGDYVALFDHDDVLHPAALYEMMRVLCDKNADIVYTDEATFISPDINKITVIHFKPDFAPDNLRSNNYICHFTAFRRSLLEDTGLFRSEYDGSQDHDMILRLAEKADVIEHIPKVLYYWRAHNGSVALDPDAKYYASEAGIRAVRDGVERMGLSGKVTASRVSGSIYRISYDIKGSPKVSIIIPTSDHIELLRKCIESIEERTAYDNYEIILVENNSRKEETFKYYETLKDKYDNIRIVTWNKDFNYSAINNYGVEQAASGDYILLLNNDTEIITSKWLEEMLMFGQREDVGAVGAKLLYPDNTIQHAGVLLGKGGIAAHYFVGVPRDSVGYMGRLCYQQNVSAVTGACMLIRKEVWNRMNGLDEGYPVAFNDVDLCMRIRKAGYLIVWTPFAELYHYESKSRGRDDDTPEKRERFLAEQIRFRTRWSEDLEAGDPYYNPNFSRDWERTDFSL